LAEKGVVNFTDFRVNYHFNEKRGTFSFTPEKNISRFIVHFPEKFEITSVERWGNHSKEPFAIEYLNLTEKFVSITFPNKSADEWIFVNFDIDLSPNANFNFFKNSIWGGNDNFYFNMGDEFECTRQDCFFNLKNTEIERDGLGTQQESSSALRFTNQTEGILSDITHEFELSARSRNALTKRNLWLSIGVSLIVGCIFVLFSIIIAIYQDFRRQ
jgi:hypothetical protein